MIIPVRTIIEEISNVLNKSKFKVGDIVYQYLDWGGAMMAREFIYEIVEIQSHYLVCSWIETRYEDGSISGRESARTILHIDGKYFSKTSTL
jgi:hypothetical protein